MDKENKINIRSLSIEELEKFFIQNGDQPFRAIQVYQWLWKKGVHDFDFMTNLSKSTRKLLKKYFVINHIAIHRQQKSKDGTVKNLIKLFDNLMVESVLIPSANRTTACISSQVGCSFDCKFCATAKIKRMRNLNTDEIYDQVVAIDQQSHHYYGRPISNIVFMGMGEPLLNYRNLIASIDKITKPEGLGISPSRITVSTSGLPKIIIKMADDRVKFGLAVSLHSAIQHIREKIMPFSVKFPLEELARSLKYWYKKTSKSVTYEYIIWKDINDNEKDISALVNFCKVIPCKVNLIEYNSIEDDEFFQADSEIVKAYQSTLEANRIIVTVRRSRGKDIDAACGQLSNKLVKA